MRVYIFCAVCSGKQRWGSWVKEQTAEWHGLVLCR